jgi:large subunit ribosomal protein L21e
MVRRKNIRTRGKISLSRFFQKFKEGDKVAVVKEISMQPRFPKRIQGKTGVVKSKRGRSYIVLIKDGNKEKEFILEPIHLKKIK